MQKTTSAVYEFGPYRLDAARRLLLRDGRSLTVAPKTFDLLLILLQSRDRVLTKKELMGALWPDSFVEEANLAFQISALRKILGANGAEWIETVPRYGYRLNVDVSQQVNELDSLEAEDSAAPREADSVRPARRLAWRWIALPAVILLSGGLGFWLRPHQSPPPARLVSFVVFPPPKVTIPEMDSIAVSPDGSRLAFIGETSDGQRRLWVRPLDSVTAEPLAGTEQVTSAFWSPDSDSIGFFAGGKLKRINLHGGPPLTICDTPSGRGSWSQSGVILVDAAGPEIYAVPASGGKLNPVTGLNRANQETFHASPQFLPDGRRFIYLVQSARPENSGIYVASLDSKQSTRIVSSMTNAAFAAGWLLFTSGGDLVRQAFDLKKLSLTGEPSIVARRIIIGLTRGLPRAAFSVSQNGVLAYRAGSGTGASELAWVDRQGHRLATLGDPADYSNPALSPDEKTVAVSRADSAGLARDLWLIDSASGTPTRFTFDPVDETNPVWLPDSREVVFNKIHNGAADIYRKSLHGGGAVREMLVSGENKQIETISPDGRFLLYRIGDRIWNLPLGGGPPTGPYAMEYPRISPDGKWLAYTSDESGRTEVYVQSFPPTEAKWQVSASGGTEPVWRRDGKELYFISGDRLVAVDAKASGPSFQAGAVRVLFTAPFEATRRRTRYQSADNGRHFLLNLPVEPSAGVTVTIRWPFDRQ